MNNYVLPPMKDNVTEHFNNKIKETIFEDILEREEIIVLEGLGNIFVKWTDPYPKWDDFHGNYMAPPKPRIEIEWFKSVEDLAARNLLFEEKRIVIKGLCTIWAEKLVNLDPKNDKYEIGSRTVQFRICCKFDETLRNNIYEKLYYKSIRKKPEHVFKLNFKDKAVEPLIKKST